MVAYAAAEGLECPGCWSNPCDCARREWEAEQADLESEQVESSARTLDGRDATRKPPAYLNALWVRRMRQRLDRYRETGQVDWFRSSLLTKICSQNHSIERIPHVPHP